MIYLFFLLVCLCTAVDPSFWLINDIHIDPNYTGFVDPNNPSNCWATKGSDPPQSFGRYGCDPNMALFNKTMSTLLELDPDPQMIILNGDFCGHNIQQEQTLKIEIVSSIWSALAQLKSTVLIPALVSAAPTGALTRSCLDRRATTMHLRTTSFRVVPITHITTLSFLCSVQVGSACNVQMRTCTSGFLCRRGRFSRTLRLLLSVAVATIPTDQLPSQAFVSSF